MSVGTSPSNADTAAVESMVDSLGRSLRDLRVSVTDRCNFRCAYCMPREAFGPDFTFLERREILQPVDARCECQAPACEAGSRRLGILDGQLHFVEPVFQFAQGLGPGVRALDRHAFRLVR